MARANMAAARRSLVRGGDGADDALAARRQDDEPAAVGRVPMDPGPSPESEGEPREPSDDSVAVEPAARNVARTKS
jgi:hypothetical protein